MNNVDVSALFAKVEKCKKVIVVGHSHPDGDCVGSAVALAALIEALGGKASVIFPEKPLPRLDFIIGERKILEELPKDFTEYDIIGVDLASPVQMASLKDDLVEKFKLRIDHHSSGTPYASFEFIDSDAGAAGEIIFDLWEYALQKGFVPAIPKSACNALFAAISSDTGCFKFANATPKTHIRAAKLMAHGADSAEVNRLLFDTKDKTQLMAEGVALHKLETFENGRISGISIELSDYGTELYIKDFETAIDIARSVRGSLYAVCVKAAPVERTFRASLRANGDVDVARIAEHFGGGGHVRAAGCSLEADSAKEALLMIVEEIKKVL